MYSVWKRLFVVASILFVTCAAFGGSFWYQLNDTKKQLANTEIQLANTVVELDTTREQLRGITSGPLLNEPKGGKVMMVATYHQAVNEWRPPIIQKCLSVIGSWGGRGKEALELMKAGKVNTEPWITHQFPLDKINEVFAAALNRDESVKILVKP